MSSVDSQPRRRSRRLAGRPIQTMEPTTQLPSFRPQRRQAQSAATENAHTQIQQDAAPTVPADFEFTFTRPDPPVPAPGFFLTYGPLGVNVAGTAGSIDIGEGAGPELTAQRPGGPVMHRRGAISGPSSGYMAREDAPSESAMEFDALPTPSSGTGTTSMDIDGLQSAPLIVQPDQSEPTQIKTDQSEPIQTNPNQFEPLQTKPEPIQSESVQSQSVQSQSVQPEPSQSRLLQPVKHDEDQRRLTDDQPPMEVPSNDKTIKVEAEEEPAFECAVCCDLVDEIQQACVGCKASYCNDCVESLFVRAIESPSAMPPKCCKMMQLHVGLPLLDPQAQEQFRKKFDEWIATDKLFCPKQSCSAFIPERTFVVISDQPAKGKDFFVPHLRSLLEVALAQPEARCFMRSANAQSSCHRGHAPDLPAMQRKLPRYRSFSEFMLDLEYVIRRAPFNWLDEPAPSREKAMLTIAAAVYKAVDKADLAPSFREKLPKDDPLFAACPECCIGVCLKCRDVAHPGKACDTTKQDYEVALAAAFKIKQCPICRTGIRKMFGCSHVECLCGAHLCWCCGMLLGNCTDQCQDEASEYGSADEDYDDDDVEDDAIPLQAQPTQMPGIDDQAQVPNAPTAITASTTVPVPEVTTPSATGSILGPVRDLDAGGLNRWGDINFGDEPDDSYSNVWNCAHVFSATEQHDHTTHRGCVAECNRCFKKMEISPRAKTGMRQSSNSPSDGLSTSKASQGQPGSRKILRPTSRLLPRKNCLENRPFSCRSCNVLYCGACKEYMMSKRGSRAS